MASKFWQEQPVTVLRTLGGWSTIRLPDGSQKKVRNSQLAAVPLPLKDMVRLCDFPDTEPEP